MSDDASPPPGGYRRSQFLIRPVLQIKLALYSLLLSFTFCGTILGLLYAQWSRFRTWLSWTGASQRVDSEIARLSTETIIYMVITLVVFLVFSVAVTVLASHRLVGPTVAFRRHIKSLTAGDYSAKTVLRDYDAFPEVAEALNALSLALRERHEPPSSPDGEKPAEEPPQEPAEE
jgi:methyl-accepting chemotaxis protein